MDKYLEQSGFKIRHYLIEFKQNDEINQTKTNQTKTDRIKKDHKFLVKHDAIQSADIISRCNAKYIFMQDYLFVLDIDSFDEIKFLFKNMTKVKIEINSDELNIEIIYVYLNKVGKKITIDDNRIDVIFKQVELLNNNQILEEKSINNTIAYAYIFFKTFNCHIDLTPNCGLHLYFKYQRY